MDIVLEVCDRFFFDKFWATVLPASSTAFNGSATSTFSSVREGATFIPQQKWTWEPATQYFSFPPTEYAWQSAWARDYTPRQFVELFFIIWAFGIILYFVCATLSYTFVFDKTTFKHPKFLKNQVRLEIEQAMWSMPGMSFLTALCFLLEVKGYAKFYDAPSEAPFPLYNYLQFPIFILFTDCFIYLIHRGLHLPIFYKALHKAHHKWIMPTPFASHAFHPIDGFAQSFPYHVFPFLFPLQKFAYLALFGFINIWTVLIHDGEYVANSAVINSSAHHSIHHSRFTMNYGQFTTLWDRLGGTHFRPPQEMFEAETKKSAELWNKEAMEAEIAQKKFEGEDERQYLNDSNAKKVQ